MYFDHIHVPPRFSPTSLLTQFHVFCLLNPFESSFCVGRLLLDMRFALECGRYTRCPVMETDVLSLGELSNVISSSVALIPTSPPPCWDLSGSSLCRFGHAHTMLVSSYVPLPCCVWKSFLEVVHHLWLFLSPLLLRSLSLEGRGMIQMSHLGLNTPESYSLSIGLLYVC